MLLTPSPFKLSGLMAVAQGRDSSLEEGGNSVESAEQPSYSGEAVCAQLRQGTAITTSEQQEEAFARLAVEVNKPQPGQAEKEELVRTASAPSQLPQPQDPPLLQTSGLDWSGSIHEATLMRFSQEFGQGGETDGSDDGAGTFSFPPKEQYRPPAAVQAMSRLSEDWARSSTLSDTISTNAGDRTVSSTLAFEDASTPRLSKQPSIAAVPEVPFESPFEARQFQEDPIVRPSSLPELEREEITRSVASVPPSQFDSMFSPSATEDPVSPSGSRLEQILQGHSDGLQPSLPDTSCTGDKEQQARLPDAPGVCISEMSHGGRRQTGIKSLSVLERDGIPFLQSRAAPGQGTSPPPVRQKLVEECGFKPRPSVNLPPAAPHRSQTLPSSVVGQALEVFRLNPQTSAFAAVQSGCGPSEPTIEEEDMMASVSLHQAIKRFQPAEEMRSPTRAPSLFDLMEGFSESSLEWLIEARDLEFGRCIGSGAFGEVFRGQWRHTDVAIKQLTNGSEMLVEDFRKEVALMSKLKHPNVVQFLGACIDYPKLSIVTQFMPRGSLFNLLHRAKVRLDDRQKLWMALDCAKGMHYLHSCRPPIVHGDVSSKNMLVDRDFSIRVADFGMSRQRRKAMLSAKGDSQGTAEWTAPEILRGLPYTESCDVYSFGVLLYELMTQQVPWAELSSIQVMGAVGWGNASLSIPDHVDPGVRQLMADCMQRTPEKRPTFEQVIVSLRSTRQTFRRTAAEPSEQPQEHSSFRSSVGANLKRCASALVTSSRRWFDFLVLLETLLIW